MQTEISEKIAAAVQSYTPSGLNEQEVKKRRDDFGPNKFEKERVSAVRIFLSQLANPLSFILIFASALSIFMGEASDAAVIMVIVLLNSVLGFVQEYRSGKAIEKLSQFIERTCVVVRSGKKTVINSAELVPGDTVILRNGDVVPADAKVLSCYNLMVNESQLSGESAAVYKSVQGGFADSDILYAGSIIEKGHCECVVFATGNQSELGKIAKLSGENKKITPHQKSLAEFSVWLLKLIGATVVLLLVVKGVTIGSVGDFAEVVLFAVALAMTTVPEALPMITTINLSYGALKLAEQNVVVKNLSAIDDLGRINILCTDKTGTLTEDRLTVTDVITADDEVFQKFAYVSIEDFALAEKKHVSSFDGAFARYVREDIKESCADWQQLFSIPFDPELRRRRIVVRDPAQQKDYLVVVGAPEIILELCTEGTKEDYLREIEVSGKKGMRQLGIAFGEIKYLPESDVLGEEHDLTFAGFANLHDPLRKTAKTAVEDAKNLGVAIKILSGDSAEVTAYTARAIGLLWEDEKACTGEELEKLSPKQFDEVVNRCHVFARVTPQQKHQVIKSLQKQGFAVGYQGDGINDAPALKQADVALAVHNATDVAKDSADIVLLEDNLDVVVNGIKYGRSIFVNINKYIKHAMIGNLGNFFSMVVFYLLFAADIPMLSIQLLVGNIIQDMPLMTVFSDSVDPDEVSAPQSAAQLKPTIKTSLKLGLFTAVYYLLFFLFVGTTATPATQTMLFLFYNFTQLLVIISVRSERHFLWQGEKPSRLLLGSIVIFMALSLVLTFIPFTAALMGFAVLPAAQIIALLGFTAAYILLLDIAKIALGKLAKK